MNLKTGLKFLNFGSQSAEYNKKNSHIINFLINPIKEKHHLINLDLKPGSGVDIVGNIYDDVFFNKIKNEKFDCILLCNVLEHVQDIQLLCSRISSLLNDGGLVFFSGPKVYPVHYDPIDNGFRPSVNQVKELFSEFSVVSGEIVTDHSFSYYLLKSPQRIIIELLRVLTPFYRYTKWKKVVIPKYKYWNRIFEVTCVILKKEVIN